jgi:hypothetical protein
MLSWQGRFRCVHVNTPFVKRVGRTLVLTQGGQLGTALHSIYPYGKTQASVLAHIQGKAIPAP